jgi:hypothetical protein
LDAGFICDVHYPSWLANVVMVKKRNEKWRMCTDFTNPNKCCQKDDFPLTIIDKVVDSAAGYKIMALLDCFSGYHRYGSTRKTTKNQVSLHRSLP